MATEEGRVSNRRVLIPLASILGLSLLVLASCATSSKTWPSSPALQFSNYHFDTNSPLEYRIMDAPAFIVDYCDGIDKTSSYQAYHPTDQELSLARRYLSELPRGYRAILHSLLHRT